MDDFFDEKDTLPENDGENQENTAQSASSAEAENGSADDKSSISADLIRGHINTIILRSLYERDKYGYEIINDIERKSHNQYSLKQPTLYSALKRLENQGYIIAYWKTDEVSSGGRRKYFTLTDSGREITEKNLAEWEYSRTIIDSLISDRSFDFTQPAPTPVDFTILRNSVSRVPVVRNEDEDDEESAQTTANTQAPAPAPAPVQNDVTETTYEQSAAYVVNETTERVEQIKEEPTPIRQEQVSEEEIEARRRVHENYMRLISEPVTEKPVDDVVPGSANVNTSKLLYNVKPDTERDYKNLINGIYEKAVTNGSVETSYARRDRRPAPVQARYSANTEIIDRGRSDGVRVTPSYEYESRSNYATKTTYNKGLTFLLCSGIVLIILLIEFIFSLIFKDSLHVSVAYPIVILLIGIVQFAVFGGMFLKGYGANCAKPLSNNYLSKCIVFTILLVLIICVSSFLFNINFTLVSDVMRLIVIPSITVLNIIVFAVSFYLMVK